MTTTDFKIGRPRIRDPRAVQIAAARRPHCVACGEIGANGHHVLPKDRGGDDVDANVVTLCGSGTMGCHGAVHGNPYEVVVVDPLTIPGDAPRSAVARRDQAWVSWRIGVHVCEERPDTIAYLVDRLGVYSAFHFLAVDLRVDPDVVESRICPFRDMVST